MTHDFENYKQQLYNEYMSKLAIAEKDYEMGKEDCRRGVYDKWYRYNHKDDGRAYDLGWMEENQVIQNEVVKFIE